jgi:predicted DsbA family dithiol-disulfide isomerase/uncharacterized membrane protein
VSIKLTALRLLALVALAASAAGLVDLLRPTPFFCGLQSSCDHVTGSSFGHLAGVPLPIVGLVAFGLFFALTLFPSSWTASLLGPMALLAGVSGLVLLILQALVLRRYCRPCLVVDACAMLLAVVYLAGPQGDSSFSRRPRHSLWVGLALAAVGVPVAWSWLQPAPPAPQEVKALWMPGKITLVLVTDFECPACRQIHPALTALLQEHGEKVHLVRLVLPLPQNPNARHAARAYWCAAEEGKGDAMAEALFNASDLSAAGCEQLAAHLGLDLAKYRQRVAEPATDEKIDTATTWVLQTSAQALPILWVQDQVLVGAQTSESLQAALDRALRRWSSAL